MMRHSVKAFCLAIGASVAAIDCTHMEPLSNAYSAFAAPVGDRCGDGERGICDVSMVELLAVPEKFHDKRVRVVGFGTLAFEGNTLCTSRHSGTGCLWLDIEGVKDPGFRKGWIVVEGRFDGENYNIGFVDVTDRPYPELTEALKAAHHRLYRVHLGSEKPYSQHAAVN